jgi:predicted deacetylase
VNHAVTIVPRYDDYHASLGEATREKEAIERSIFAAFTEHRLPLTVGVVPDIEGKRPLGDDPASLAILREAVTAGRVRAALHGLTHEGLSRPGAPKSEFAGQPREAQLERLRKGKVLLEDWLGVPVLTFIPPWNTYDDATVSALAEAGFAVLSAALSGPPVRGPVVAIPHTAGLADLRRLIPRLARRRGHSVVVCTFHCFSFKESTDDPARLYGRTSLAGLGELLAWCKSQPNVEFATVGEAATRYRDELCDGRVDKARRRWYLAFRWRRVPALGRVSRWLWEPKALVPPRRG